MQVWVWTSEVQQTFTEQWPQDKSQTKCWTRIIFPPKVSENQVLELSPTHR